MPINNSSIIFDSKTISMIGITVLGHRLIIFYALKHFYKHSLRGQFKESGSVTRDKW